MLRVRFSLFSKIMLWFFLNLIVLGAVFAIAVSLDFRLERSASFFAPVNRLETLARQVTNEAQDKTRGERDEILQKYAESYNVDLYVFDDRGAQLAGREITLPPEIAERVTSGRMPAPVREKQIGAPPPPREPGRPPAPFFYTRTSNPTRYWSSAPVLIFDKDGGEPRRSRLVAASDSITGHGLFFNPLPWLATIGVVIVVSMLVWLPFVRSLTKNIAEMNRAAEKIAEEDFKVRVSEKRTDELGRLGASINHLATRLEGFVGGQKRFLGDISHELNSPLARMQFALSILEDRADEKNLGYVLDVKEEVELMSRLVGELLTYSKAGIKAPTVELERVALRPLLDRVAERETANLAAQIKIAVAEKIEVLAQPELLARAVGNVVRNAVRYAGEAGEINISAENDGGTVEIKIADQGAGVPPDALEKLFDPFYRVETHRSRESGGTGLGLAIVKTCIEACRGKVAARNLEPTGFEISILLKSA